jgi:hypothetical protein
MARAKKAGRSTLRPVAVPTGFVNASGSGDFAPTWEPKIGETLAGICVSKRGLDAKIAGRKKAKKGETVTLVSVADAQTGEVFTIWESHALQQFCKQVQQNDEVIVTFKGVKKFGKKSLKQFTAFIKPAKRK